MRSFVFSAGFCAIALSLPACGESAGPKAAPHDSASDGGSHASLPGAGQTSGGSGGALSVAGAGGSSSAGASSGGMAGVAMQPDTSPELYDPTKLPRFDIDLPPESVAALEQAPDVYVHGTLHYGDEVVSDIGVRIKGEASQRTLQEKAAFKLKFDEFVDKQTFRGLRRMTFNNMVEDPSFLAERMAFHVFRELELPAPRCNSALVYVNGDYFGVYANIETEDKTFLRRWFASDAGNLYEEGQVDFEPGNENAFDLETNETQNDRSDLTGLFAAIASAQSASFVADVGAQLDMTHFLAFTAAEAAVNQWDMYAYTVFYPNNFRIYRDPTSSKFVILPWGMDMSMKPFRDSGKPHIDVQALSREGDFPEGKVTAGLIFRGCMQSPGCKDAYLKRVLATADAYEQAGLEALAKQYFAQIQPEIAKDSRKEYSMAEVEAGYQSLLQTIRERPAALRDSAAD